MNLIQEIGRHPDLTPPRHSRSRSSRANAGAPVKLETVAVFLFHCPCRKLKLEHIGGGVRLKVAPELRGLRFGRHAR
jgi:hypothetical protein